MSERTKYHDYKILHKVELELNLIKYNGLPLGNLLSCYLDVLDLKKFSRSSIKKVALYLYYLIKPFSKKNILKNRKKKLIYFCSGNFRHLQELRKTISDNINIDEMSLIVSTSNNKVFDKKIFFLTGFIDFFQTFIFIFRNFKKINYKIKPLNSSFIEKASLFLELHMQLLKAISLMKFIKSQSQTKLIGSDFDRGHDSQLFFAVAKSLKIESFVFQHGAHNEPFGLFNADEYWVWGEMSKRQVLEIGVSNSKIIVTGTPIIQDINVSDITRNKLRLKQGKNIVLALSTTNKNHNLKMIKFLSNLKKLNYKTSDNFFVKIYPSLKINDYIWVKQKYNFDLLPPDIPFENFINMIDILITDTSSVANEALYFNKKVCVLDIIDMPNHNGLELNKYLNVPLVDELTSLEELYNIKNIDNKKFLYYKIGDEAKTEIQKKILEKLK